MSNPKEIINAINKAINPFLLDNGKSIHLSRFKSDRIFRLQLSDVSSMAFNNRKNGGDEVKVVKWFNDFWLFIEVQFLSPRGSRISLTVFQGQEEDVVKNQLFRAEWDDYDDDQNIHPQPHWHFLSYKKIENTVNQFAELVENEQDTFETLLNEEKNKLVDMDKFHFAMNGNWRENSNHIHKITDSRELAKWFGGLLSHLKSELEYLDN